MSYGRVDRGGSREGKKSLRKNKIAIVDITKKKQDKDNALKALQTGKPPAIQPATDESLTRIIDAGCNLVARVFESDQKRVIERAIQGGISAMIVLTSDMDKQQLVPELSKEYPGVIYSCVGIHPNNVKRTNDKLFNQKVETLRDFALLDQTVAISCGLDHTREVATQYPQEHLFQHHLELAAEFKLPVLVYDVEATSKIVEILSNSEAAKNIPEFAVHNFLGSEEDFNLYMGLENIKMNFVLSGALCDPQTELSAALIKMLPKIPIERILIGTDSPKYTPQNIEDPFIRQQKNEPSNLPYVLNTIAQTLQITTEELASTLYANTKRFFQLEDFADNAVAESETSTTSNVNETDESTQNKDTSKEGESTKVAESEPSTTTPVTSTTSGVTDVRYSCMNCREVLFTSAIVQPPEVGLAVLKEGGIVDAERTSNDVWFVQQLPWFPQDILITSKLDCPHCNMRNIGRAFRCGDTVIGTIRKNRIDVILQGSSDATTRAASRLDEMNIHEDGDSQPAKKKKRAKKTNKQQKKKNLSNMGNFRNKSYGDKPSADKQQQ